MSKLYKEFHGNPPARVRRVKLRVPKKGDRLVMLGRLIEIVYAPQYTSKLKGKVYIHKMGDTGTMVLKHKPILATGEDGRGLYILEDKSSPKVTRRGIEG